MENKQQKQKRMLVNNLMIWFFFYIKTWVHGILTWIYEFRPGSKSIYVVLDEESEFSGPRTPKLSLDQVVEEKL